MKVTAERLPDSQVQLNVEVEPERVAASLERAYRRIAQRVRIPGFRPGKAPRHIVERFVGRELIRQEALDSLVAEAYQEAVRETGIRPVGEPTIDVVQQEPLVFRATVPVMPTVELGDYRSIRLKPIAIDVLPEQVERVLDQLREQFTRWEPVDRPAQAGDRLTLDLVVRVGAYTTLYSPTGEPLLQSGEGEVIAEAVAADYLLQPDNEEPVPDLEEVVPGFTAQLLGLTAGQRKVFQLSLPTSFPAKDLAGRLATFTVVVQAVKEKRVPALDDEFARMVGDYASLEQLRAAIREQLRQELERQARRQLEQAVLNEAVARSRVELPPQLIERAATEMLEDLRRRLRQQGLTFEQYLALTQQTEEGLRQELRQRAERSLKEHLVLHAIGEREGITVETTEVTAEIERLSGAFGEQAEQVRRALEEPAQRQEISEDLWHRRVLDFLVGLATAESAPADETGQTATTDEAAAPPTTEPAGEQSS